MASTDQYPPMPDAAEAAQSPLRSRLMVGMLIVFVTMLTFFRVQEGGFTNWDDTVYVFQNPQVLAQDYKGCFTTPVVNAYNPLPQVVFTWEWGLTQNEPALMKKAWVFHFTNWLLHVLTTLLVFVLMQRLGLQALWAGLAALLFGIHPLRVESVAWVTELKDVMYALFFVASLLSYLQFVQGKQKLWWLLTMVFFLLSLLSKVQAATLPLTLLAIDWYQGRKLDWRNLGAKVPFFLGSLAFGILGLLMVAREDSGLPEAAPVLNLWERGIVAISVFGTYLLKQFVPYAVSPAYPTPTAVGLGMYLQAFLTLGVVAGAILLRQRSRAAFFGFMFFGVNVLFMLANGELSNSYLADRFCYVGSIGAFFALLMTVQDLALWGKIWTRIGGSLVGAYALVCIWITVGYVPVWQTSFTLWDYVIQQYPEQVPLSYMNRADYYCSVSKFDVAQEDYEKVVALWPENVLGYLLRGRNQLALGRYAGVVDDMGQVIAAYKEADLRLDGPIVLYEGYLYRGIGYLQLHRTDEAIGDMTKALQMRPNDIMAIKQRADAHLQANDLRAAVGDLSQAINLQPNDADTYNRRGFCYMNLKDYPPSLADFDRAIALDPVNGQTFNNRAFIHFLMKNKSMALQDAEMALQLGFPVEQAFLDSLGHEHGE